MLFSFLILFYKMSFSQQKFREIVLQVLFSIDVGESREEDLIPFVMNELSVTRKIVRAAYQQALSIWAKREEIDQKIQRLSLEYALERIGRVERNVLRLGIFELYNVPELASEIVIAESIRLSRKFSTPESANFVNAIMDAVHKEENTHASLCP